MDLEFVINNQTLKRTDSQKPVNESITYLRLKFVFSDDWTSNYTKYVFFRQKGVNYAYPINNQGVVTVPKEFLANDRLIFGVYGITGSEGQIDSRITTNMLHILLGDSGLNRDFAEIDETIWNETIVEQITEELEQKVDKVNGKGLSANDFSDNYKSLIDNSKTLRLAAVTQSSTRTQFYATINSLTVAHGTILGILNSKGYNYDDATLTVNDFPEKPIYVGNVPIKMYEFAFGRIGLFVYVTWTSINQGEGAWVLLNPYQVE